MGGLGKGFGVWWRGRDKADSHTHAYLNTPNQPNSITTPRKPNQTKPHPTHSYLSLSLRPFITKANDIPSPTFKFHHFDIPSSATWTGPCRAS